MLITGKMIKILFLATILFLAMSCKTSNKDRGDEAVDVTFQYAPLPHEHIDSIKLLGSMNGFNAKDEAFSMNKLEDGSFCLNLQLAPGDYLFAFMINGKWVHKMSSIKDRMLPTNVSFDEGFGSAKFTVKPGDELLKNLKVDSINHNQYSVKKLEGLEIELTNEKAFIEWETSGTKDEKVEVLTRLVKETSYIPDFSLIKTEEAILGRTSIDVESLADMEILVRLSDCDGTKSEGQIRRVRIPHPNVTFTKVDNRGVYVYLPEGYDPQRAAPYPVAYMLDGQNLFSKATGGNGEWEVDEVLDSLITNKIIEPVVVVGISNGIYRAQEYIPYNTNWYGSEHVGKDVYHATWITEQLIPVIEKDYNVSDNRDGRAIFGNSLGGLLSLYMILYQSDVFSKGVSISPATVKGIIPLVSESQKQDVKLWIDTGEDEWGGYISYVDQERAIVDTLCAKGYEYGKELVYYEVPGVPDHRESYLAQRIALPFVYMYGDCNPELDDFQVFLEQVEHPVEITTPILNPVVSFNNGLKYSLYTLPEYSVNDSEVSISDTGIFSSNELINIKAIVLYSGIKKEIEINKLFKPNKSF